MEVSEQIDHQARQSYLIQQFQRANQQAQQRQLTPIASSAMKRPPTNDTFYVFAMHCPCCEGKFLGCKTCGGGPCRTFLTPDEIQYFQSVEHKETKLLPPRLQKMQADYIARENERLGKKAAECPSVETDGASAHAPVPRDPSSPPPGFGALALAAQNANANKQGASQQGLSHEAAPFVPGNLPLNMDDPHPNMATNMMHHMMPMPHAHGNPMVPNSPMGMPINHMQNPMFQRFGPGMMMPPMHINAVQQQNMNINNSPYAHQNNVNNSRNHASPYNSGHGGQRTKHTDSLPLPQVGVANDYWDKRAQRPLLRNPTPTPTAAARPKWHFRGAVKSFKEKTISKLSTDPRATYGGYGFFSRDQFVARGVAFEKDIRFKPEHLPQSCHDPNGLVFDFELVINNV